MQHAALPIVFDILYVYSKIRRRSVVIVVIQCEDPVDCFSQAIRHQFMCGWLCALRR